MSDNSKSPINDFTATFAELQKTLDPNSIMSQSIDSILKFQETLNKITPLMPLNKTFTNPNQEANERLENIEKKFGDLHTIAAENAKIANMLNASAAEFLVKFEKSSMENQKSAKIAIILATLAIFANLISPYLPNIVHMFK